MVPGAADYPVIEIQRSRETFPPAGDIDEHVEVEEDPHKYFFAT